jgi:hypothetical protein
MKDFRDADVAIDFSIPAVASNDCIVSMLMFPISEPHRLNITTKMVALCKRKMVDLYPVQILVWRKSFF